MIELNYLLIYSMANQSNNILDELLAELEKPQGPNSFIRQNMSANKSRRNNDKTEHLSASPNFTEKTEKPALSPSPMVEGSRKVPPKVPTVMSKNDELKSSGLIEQPQSLIRTMREDLEMLKKGQKPTGFDSGRSSMAILPSSPIIINKSQPIDSEDKSASLDSTNKARLGETEQSRGLSPIPRSFRLSPDGTPRDISRSMPHPPPALGTRVKVKEKAGGTASYKYLPANFSFLGDIFDRLKTKLKTNPRTVMMIASAILISSAVYWAVSKLDLYKEEIFLTQTPLTTPAGTDSPTFSITSLFNRMGRINIELVKSKSTTINLNKKISEEYLTNNQFKRVDVLIVDESSSARPGWLGLMDLFSIDYPSSIKNIISEDSLVLLYGQKELFNKDGSVYDNLSQSISQNRLAIVVEVNDPSITESVMREWENNMVNDLADLFGLAMETKPGPIEFSSNNYGSALIRYANFPFPDKSIDYSVSTASNGKYYLVMANSRESIYKTIDNLKD